MPSIPIVFEPADDAANGARAYLLRRGNVQITVQPTSIFLFADGDHSRIMFDGARADADMRGTAQLPGRSNYLTGRDRSKWRTGVPHFAAVDVLGLYPGIDVAYYGRDGNLEYDFRIAPGGDPGRIRMRVDGAGGVSLTATGDLCLTVGTTIITNRRPNAYQLRDGHRVQIAASYRRIRGNLIGIRVTKYDRSLPLIIDPVLTFSTYLGGSSTDRAKAIGTDAAGNIFVLGSTVSLDFPGQSVSQQNTRVFVVKLNPSTSQIVYSTWLGSYALPGALAVDAAGHAYITGQALSSEFPLQAPLQTGFRGGAEGFVAKLNVSGDGLVYSTLLGGNYNDSVATIAIDAAGCAYVAGTTSSTDFPTVNAYQAVPAGLTDGFVSKLNGDGSAFVFSTYVGGSDHDGISGIAIDTAGEPHVSGATSSADFPIVAAVQGPGIAGPYPSAAFVAKFNASASALVYSTYLGVSDFHAQTTSAGIALDSTGNAYVTGVTTNPRFPLMNPIQTAPGRSDCFLTKLAPQGTLMFSTFLGSGSEDLCTSITVDTFDRAIIAGRTMGSDFPLVDPIAQSSGVFFVSGFVAAVDSVSPAIRFSTTIGSAESQNDIDGVSVDAAGNIYIAGTAWGENYPVVAPVQPNFMGGQEPVVSKIATGTSCTFSVSPTVYPIPIPPAGGTGTIMVTAPAGCRWNAINHNPGLTVGQWVAYGSYLSGSGTLVVPFTVGYANGPDRSFDFVVAGKRVTVNQTGYGCPYSISPTESVIFPATGGAGSFTVVTGSACPHTAAASDPWITIQPPASGLSGGIVHYVVAPNPSASYRRGTISAGGQLFTVRQEAGRVRGDLDGNGTPDLIWQNDVTRQSTVNYFSSATLVDWAWLYPDPVEGWTIVGSGDFNSDGTPDIVWQNDQTRQTTVNYFGGTNGSTLIGWAWLYPNAVTGWRIAAIADFNRDGHPDVIWQNDETRQVTVNFFGGEEGAQLTGWAWLYPSPVPGWRIAAAADLNRDRNPDIIWQEEATRRVTVNFFGGTNGTAMTGWAWLYGTPVPGWRVSGATDLNDDGSVDMIWQNDETRQVTVNYFGGNDGTAMIGWAWLCGGPVPQWRVIVP